MLLVELEFSKLKKLQETLSYQLKSKIKMTAKANLSTNHLGHRKNQKMTLNRKLRRIESDSNESLNFKKKNDL